MLSIVVITLALLLLVLAYRLRIRAVENRRFRNSLHFGAEIIPRLRISVVAPRSQSIGCVASLLKSESNAYQVVVVDDFSRHAKLLEAIISHFELIKVGYTPGGELPEDAVRGVYRSLRRLYSKLLIVDSPHDDLYTAEQVGAALSSFDYTLLLDSQRPLRPTAIDDLLLEIALRPQGQVDEIASRRGEKFRLVRREAAATLNTRARAPYGKHIVEIDYKILK